MISDASVKRIMHEGCTAVGLMSGTSMDGVDAALLKISGDLDRPEVELMAFISTPYPQEQRDALSDISVGHQCTAEEIAVLNTGVAVAFSKGFFEVCRKAGCDAGSVDFIGSHGQTIAHVPPLYEGRAIAGTLQIGSPAMIAALTGVTTVGDFRVADMALGGQGAPLAPYADYLLRRSEKHSRIILNVGGIANVTYLPRGGRLEDTIAFDTGPGNMVCDAIYRGLYPGEGEYDESGEIAGRGKCHDDLVERFLKLPYFKRRPPKSTGHGDFGVHFAWEFLARAREAGLSREDILASALHLTTASVAGAVNEYIRPHGEIDEVLVSGGGEKNRTLMDLLSKELAPARVTSIEELGVPAEAKEAVDFAVLARETLLGRANVIAAATGASKSLVLGTIAFGEKG